MSLSLECSVCQAPCWAAFGYLLLSSSQQPHYPPCFLSGWLREEERDQVGGKGGKARLGPRASDPKPMLSALYPWRLQTRTHVAPKQMALGVPDKAIEEKRREQGEALAPATWPLMVATCDEGPGNSACLPEARACIHTCTRTHACGGCHQGPLAPTPPSAPALGETCPGVEAEVTPSLRHI